MKLTKTILKLELKCNNNTGRALDDVFKEYERLVRIVDSFVYHVYPCYARPDNEKYANSEELKDKLKDFIKDAKKHYDIKIRYTYPENNGMLIDLVHSNAETAYKHRSIPVLTGLSNTIPIRVSKRPLPTNRRNLTNHNYYQRTATFMINGSYIVFRIGGARNGLPFPIALKFNDAERLQMIKDAIEGNNGLTIGDPCHLVRKKVNGNGYRYYIHVSVSKNVDRRAIEEAINKKSIIRIVGVDLGISKYLATLFCIEVDKANQTYKLINAKGIDSDNYIHAIKKYEEERAKLQQGRMKGKVNKKKTSRYKQSEDYIINNAIGESKRIDLRRQLIGYLCNQIIKFAKENYADVIVIEDLKGLSREMKYLKKIKNVLGKLYNDVNSNGIKSIGEYIKKHKEDKDKTKKTKDILEILNKIKDCAYTNANNHNHNIRGVAKYILKQRDRIKKRIFLLSIFAYHQFKNELEVEALWHDKLVYSIYPSYTSQQCLACFKINKLNRLTQRRFKCIKCNFEMNADFNASANIALRYTEKILKLILNPLKQGESSSTMTITSATTPLQASINASSKVGVGVNNTDGIVACTMSSVTSTLQGSGEGRSLTIRGQTKLPCSAKRLVTLDEFIHEKKGNGG